MVKSFFPQYLSEALYLAAQNEIYPIAGGTDLMVKNRQPSGLLPSFQKNLVFTKNIKELQILVSDSQQVFIGANITLSQLITWAYTPEILRLALVEMASPAIRNMGTIGGNVCNASPAGDTLPPLYVLNAVVCLKSMDESREIPIQEFILGPGKTALQKGELVVGLKIPISKVTHVFYKKVAMRKASAIAKVSFAMLARKKGDEISAIAIAIGAVGPTVVRLPEAEKLLRGNTELEFREAYRVYDEAIKPIDDIRSSAAYRKKVAMNLIDHVCEKYLK